LRRRTRELEKVIAHSPVLGHPPEESMTRPPSSPRLQDADERYIFRVRNGKLTDATGVEATSAGCGNPASTRDAKGRSKN
jgi:hypothetical protein